jgi:SPRY domain
MSVITNNLLLGDDGYNISRSVRLRSSASAYFNRTPASATNRTTWTWSGWVKRGTLGATQQLFGADSTTGGGSIPRCQLMFTSSDQLDFSNNVTGSAWVDLISTPVYRDPSAWYHIVCAVDTTQATSTNRVKLYINGSQITAFGTAGYPAQNDNTTVNSTGPHNIGRYQNTATQYFDGYLTEINFVDGQALTPSSFGETDVLTGVWKAKKYAGTYGTNGFYLNFSDPSAATAAAIGKDYSGNGNNWTPNNISVTSGVTYDSMIDVPTLYADGDNGRGNYAVVSPIDMFINTTGVASNGNLTFTSPTSAGTDSATTGTVGSNSGSWYFEATIAQGTTDTNAQVGVLQSHTNSGFGSYSCTLNFYTNGTTSSTFKNGSSSQTGLTACTTNDVIGVAFDATNGTMQFYRNGSTYGSQITGLTAGTYVPCVYAQTSGTSTRWILNFNFGQRPFTYTPPTGFKALNTQNLPDATIKKGSTAFNIVTRSGTGATYTKTGLGFQPDFAWTKLRNTAYNHLLQDSVRGVAKQLNSDTTSAEQSLSNAYTSFNSDGYTLGTNTGVNDVLYTYVDWLWKKGAAQGFDIVTYTGNGSAGRTVAHSLGVAPKFIITKHKDTTDNWAVYHASLGTGTYGPNYLFLNSTAAQGTTGDLWRTPTSTNMIVGSDNLVNLNAGSYVSYLFAEVAGFSKFGIYTGNGSTDGPFVYCGFRPRYVMVKASSTAGDWPIFDSSRDTYNLMPDALFADLSNAENNTYGIDFLSNGFKLRSTAGNTNTSSATYIYAAFAENPFKNSLAR